MRVIYIGWLLLGLASAQTWNVNLNETKFQIEIGEIVTVPFQITHANGANKPRIIVKNADEKVVTVDTPFLDPTESNENYWNYSIKITGIFLGKTKLSVEITNDEVTKYFIVTSKFLP